MGRKTCYSAEQLETAGRCFDEGWGYKRMASHLGIPVYTVKDWFRTWRNRDDVEPGNLSAGVPLHPLGLRSEVREARRQGLTLSELESLFHVPRATVRFWCRGIVVPRRSQED